MPSRYRWIVLDDFSGGRDAASDPTSIGKNQVVQARNGDWYRTKGFRKRGGATAPSIGSAFTGVIGSLITHFRNNNPANVELWGACSDEIVARMAAATTFSSVTLTDALAANVAPTMRGVSFNGKLFLLYDSAVDRSHVWDPNLATPRVRRVGQATPAAPSVANTGSGSYAATIRYYRVRYRIKNGTAIVAQSEASASTSFTPSGSGTHARVTKPASISEEETHWVVEGSADNTTFYQLSEIAVATTTYDDNAAPSGYSANAISAVTGAYTVPASYKYGIAAFNRLLFAGTWESGGLQSRVFYTPARGTADRGDDERIPNTLGVRNWFDLDEGTGGDITGFAGPMYGAVYVFKYKQIRKVIPTGSPSPVFHVVEISTNYGALEQECIAIGEDAEGRPAAFFLDAQVGPMMVGPVPPTPIGGGIRDLWDSVNLAATTKVGQVLDYPAKRQVWFWWASGSSNDPDVWAIYHKDTGAWSVEDTGGQVRSARAATLFARTPGASMSRDLVPYVAQIGANNRLLRCDTTDTDDNATTFQTIIKTRPYSWNNGKPIRATDVYLLAEAAAGVTLTVTADLDFGRETRSATVSIAADASETHVFRKVEGLDVSGGTYIQFQIGDAAAIANNWQVIAIYVPVAGEEANP